MKALLMEAPYGYLDLQEREFVDPAERLQLDKRQGRLIAYCTENDIAELKAWA